MDNGADCAIMKVGRHGRMEEKQDILGRGTVIAGLGLMGSSFARAIKDLSSSYYVAGIDMMEQPVYQGLRDRVLDEGAVLRHDEEKVRRLLGEAGLIILSMYPEGILEFIDRYRDSLTPGTVMMDICGLKGQLVEDAQSRMPDGVEYMATHPMAGKEKSGYENGDGEMFLGAGFILTPTERNTESTIMQLRDLASRMGFGKIREVTPEEHDERIAYTSHLPHVLASSLIDSWDGDHDVSAFAGGSFRDATRVAEINAELWTQLFLHNRKPLLSRLSQYMESLERFRDLLERSDEKGIRSYLEHSSERKKEWNRKVDQYDDGTTVH